MKANVKEVSRRLFEELWNQGKLELIDELVDPQFRGNDPLLGVFDRKAYKEAVKNYRATFSRLTFEIDAMISEGDVVATTWTATGTHTGPFGALAPTGKTATVRGITVAEYEDGKLISSTSQMDTLGLMRQLGADVTPVVAGPELKPTAGVGARH